MSSKKIKYKAFPKQHYLYVLLFSITLWLFLALLFGGLFPIWFVQIGYEYCECGMHFTHTNLSFIIYGGVGIILGFIFSYPLHRMMRVNYSKPDDMLVPMSFLARYGKSIYGWRGIIVLILIAGIHIAGNQVSYSFFGTHKTEKVKRKHGLILHCAAARGNIAEIRAEIEKGMDVNRKGNYSCFWGAWVSPARIALEANRTPLHVAIKSGHTEIARFLVGKGADVNAVGHLDYTSLHYAAWYKHKDIAEFLIKNGADVNAWCKVLSHDRLFIEHGGTPLDLARTDEMKDFLRSHGGKTGDELKKEAGE